jgi:6-phosphogluconolactonase
MTVKINRFDDRSSMVEALQREFSEQLQQALEQRQQATLLLSGGSTPEPLYQQLSRTDLAWERINVALVDERWVNSDNVASNERFLRESLCVNQASKATLLGMKNNAASVFDGVDECNSNYARLPKPYDICLLGMGGDGHTASLFPGAAGLDEALHSQLPCAAIRANPSEVTGKLLHRMTLTAPQILSSEKLILMITGDAKWQVFEKASNALDATRLPISFFIHQTRLPLEVYWSP